METILDIAFQLYRAAQDTPLEDFEALALSILKVLVPFCAAVWMAADYGRGRLRVRRAHLHNAPPEAIEFLASSGRALAIAAGLPRRAHPFNAADHYQYQLLIADLPALSSRGNWLALFRPEEQVAFARHELDAVALLMPHLSQALALNRALHLERGSLDARAASGRALVRSDGTVIHCGDALAAVIRAEYPAWDEVLLPKRLLQQVRCNDTLYLGCDTCVRITRTGKARLLTLNPVRPAERLSPQQLAVAQLFGAGASYKEIARRVTLAPATVRNVVQVTYRKLGVKNKVQLARLMADFHGAASGAGP